MLFGHGMWEFFASLSGIQELGKWAEKKQREREKKPSTLPSLSSNFFPMLQHTEVWKAA